MVILVRLKWWYWHEFGLRPFIFSSVIILASWAGDFLAWVSKGVSEFKQDLNKSAELSPSDSNIYFISHSCNLFGPSLQNANPNSNWLFSVALKCTFSLNSLSSYLSCSHQYLLSCKKPFARDPTQLGALPPKTSSTGLFAKMQWVKGSRVNSAPLCPSWEQSPHRSCKHPTPLDPDSVPKAGAGNKTNYLSPSKSIRAQESLKANLCQDP